MRTVTWTRFFPAILLVASTRGMAAALLAVLSLLLLSSTTVVYGDSPLADVTGQDGNLPGRPEVWRDPDLVVHTTFLPVVQTRQRTEDEELVFLAGDGRVRVVDPYVPPGYEMLNWQSSTVGWTAVILGDFNGDGDEEILAFQGGHAELFDPLVQPGRVSVFGQWDVAAPHVWYNAATGDVDGDGRDEVVLLRSDDAAGNVKSRVQIYDGDAAGTIWALQRDLAYGTRWDDVALGDVNADGRDDLGLIRDEDKRLLILNPVDWTALHEARYSFPWLDLEITNTHKTSGADRTEIALTRSRVEAVLPSLLVFRWSGGTSINDLWQGHFYPYFTDIEGADLNGDGDQEILMYRDRDDVGITLASRNIAGAAMRTFEPVGAGSPGAGWLNLKAGDLEGDGRDEVVLVRSGRYRVYDQPEVDDHFSDVAGSFRRSFAVGDLDG